MYSLDKPKWAYLLMEQDRFCIAGFICFIWMQCLCLNTIIEPISGSCYQWGDSLTEAISKLVRQIIKSKEKYYCLQQCETSLTWFLILIYCLIFKFQSTFSNRPQPNFVWRMNFYESTFLINQLIWNPFIFEALWNYSKSLMSFLLLLVLCRKCD